MIPPPPPARRPPQGERRVEIGISSRSGSVLCSSSSAKGKRILSSPRRSSCRPTPVEAWTALKSGTGAHLQAVTFSDPTHGWAVADAGTVLATIDGGATWTSQSSGISEKTWGVALAGTPHGCAVSWGETIRATCEGGP